MSIQKSFPYLLFLRSSHRTHIPAVTRALDAIIHVIAVIPGTLDAAVVLARIFGFSLGMISTYFYPPPSYILVRISA